MTMRIIPESHHFKPSFHPSKQKSSAGKDGEISSEKDKYQDRLEISHHNNNLRQSSKILDDQYQRYPAGERTKETDRVADSTGVQKEGVPVSENVRSNENVSSIQKNEAEDKFLLDEIGLTNDRIEEIRRQISDGMYESVVVQKTVADMISWDLLKLE